MLLERVQLTKNFVKFLVPFVLMLEFVESVYLLLTAQFLLLGFFDHRSVNPPKKLPQTLFEFILLDD